MRRASSIAGVLSLLGILWGVLVGVDLSQSRLVPENVVVRSATAPTDTTVLWIDEDNGRGYTFFSGEWLGISENGPFVFGKGAAGITGALNVCGVAAAPSDSTTDAEQGFFFPERQRITRVTALCNDAVAPACTLQVFSDRLLRQWAWGARLVSFVGAGADTIGAGDVLSCYLLAAAVPQNPDSVTVQVYTKERVAP